MKRDYTNLKQWLLICLVGLLHWSLQAQESISRTIKADLPKIAGGTLDIEHSRGDLLIREASGSDGKVTLEIEVKGRYPEETEAFIETLELNLSGSESNRRISVSDQIKNWSKMLNRSRLKMQNGDVYRGITDFKMHMVVEVPALSQLEARNRYHDIHLQTSRLGDVEIELYSGELHAGDLEGDLELEVKYGEATWGSVQDLDLKLYESEIKSGNANQVKAETKYSELEMGTLGSLDLNSYEDEVSIEQVRGAVELYAKYGSFEMGNLGDVKIDLYETDVEAQNAGDIVGNCKYGKLKFAQVGKVDLSSDYEMDVTLASCDQLLLSESKYGEFDVGGLATKAKISAYETTVEVESVAASLQEIWIDSKYDHMRFLLPKTLKFSMDAELKYGELDYEEGGFAKHNRSEKSSVLSVLASHDNPAAKVYIRSYETDIDLN